MKKLSAIFCSALALIFSVLSAAAQEKEKDVFNYPAQKAAKGVKKIVFVADPGTHGAKGNHEFTAGAMYLARTLNAAYPDKAYAVVYSSKSWPKDLSDADAIIVLLNHGRSAVNPAVKEAMARGAGFMAIHYGVEVNKGVEGDNYLKWIGGYFEPNWSVNPFWTPNFTKFPEHETTRGVKPFSVKDEWYYHMRFVEDMKGVTPVLSALPELKTIQGEGKKTLTHGGNPFAYDDVKAGKPQHVAWAYVRPDSGRGFGFTGYHNFSNLESDGFRTLLLNACAWTAHLEIPATGVPSQSLTKSDLDKLYEESLRYRK